MKLFLLYLLFSAVVLQPSLALDPGTVKGSLLVNAETISLSRAYAHLHDNEEGVLDSPKELQITGERIGGEIAHHDVSKPEFEDMPKLSYAVRFSAPLFHEPPVTADLKGKAAQDSPQALVIREKARALAKGDLEAVQRVSTERANRQNRPFLASADKSSTEQLASDMEQDIIIGGNPEGSPVGWRQAT